MIELTYDDDVDTLVLRWREDAYIAHFVDNHYAVLLDGIGGNVGGIMIEAASRVFPLDLFSIRG